MTKSNGSISPEVKRVARTPRLPRGGRTGRRPTGPPRHDWRFSNGPTFVQQPPWIRAVSAPVLPFHGCSSEAEADPHARDGRCSSRATAWPERLGTPASLRERARSPVRRSLTYTACDPAGVSRSPRNTAPRDPWTARSPRGSELGPQRLVSYLVR